LQRIFGAQFRRSRNNIDLLAAKPFRQLPTVARQHGLPPIGFEIVTELERSAARTGVRFTERRDGTVIGELEVEVFAAALIIDRDGTLETLATSATRTPAVPFTLGRASGFRAEAVTEGELRYLHVLAIAHDDAIDGGVLVTMRCSRPAWPAAEAMLGSLRILMRGATPGGPVNV
jgi:hypothetical protein